MWVSTFHSACVRILRKEVGHLGYERVKSNFSIYDAQDQKRLITLVCNDLELDPRKFQPGPVLHWISNHKNELRDPDEVAARGRATASSETYAAAYKAYQRRLREANAFDFDDLIMETVRLFQRQARRSARPTGGGSGTSWSTSTRTPTTRSTRSSTSCAARTSRTHDPTTLDGRPADRVPPAELMVVGDADQSIYAFRGADIRNIMDFEQDFPDARTIMLEQNYRSTQTILSAANAVIERNDSRKPKRLWSDAGDGEKIVGYVADDEHDEARFVSGEIDKLTDAGGLKPSDVAVFYRTNAQSRVFEEIFIRTGMPYKVVGGVRFYERQARSATRSPTCGCWSIPTTRCRCGGSSTHPSAGSATAPWPRDHRVRGPGADHLLGGAPARRRGAGPGHPQPDQHRGLRRDGAGPPADGRRRGSART